MFSLNYTGFLADHTEHSRIGYWHDIVVRLSVCDALHCRPDVNFHHPTVRFNSYKCVNEYEDLYSA